MLILVKYTVESVNQKLQLILFSLSDVMKNT